MAERNAVRARKCSRCQRDLEITAHGLKEHWRTCRALPETLAAWSTPSLADTLLGESQ